MANGCVYMERKKSYNWKDLNRYERKEWWRGDKRD